jgi:hypothetical protein
LDRDATLTVEIQKYDLLAGTIVLKTFVLTFSRQTEIDISNLILPYLQSEGMPLRIKTTVEGVIGEVGQTPTVNYHVACEGYAYYEEGYNYNASTYVTENANYVGSTDCVYHLDDTSVRG